MKQPLILLGFVLAFWAGFGAAQEAPVHPLAGKCFVSLEKLQSGETRKGDIVLDYWHIQFKDKTYSWRYSDVIAEGSYTIDAKTGVLAVKATHRKFEASFDAKTGVLSWDKRKYKAANSKK